jgi:hypothetical protein
MENLHVVTPPWWRRDMRASMGKSPEITVAAGGTDEEGDDIRNQ